MKNWVSPKCRFCDQCDETIDHLVSGCPVLKPKEYKARHDRVGQYLHWTISKHYNMSHSQARRQLNWNGGGGMDSQYKFLSELLSDQAAFITSPKTSLAIYWGGALPPLPPSVYGPAHSAKWYEHTTPPIMEGENITILWDFSINTDRAIQANRPDVVIKYHKNKTCFLVDMAIPTDRNISIKEFDKLSKYKDLQIEIERMWHLKTTVIPIVVGALGMVKRGIQNHLKSLPGEPKLQEIQKIVLTSTAHILRKALSI